MHTVDIHKYLLQDIDNPEATSLLAENALLKQCIEITQRHVHELLNKVINGTDIALFAQVAIHHELTKMQKIHATRRRLQLHRYEFIDQYEKEMLMSFIPALWNDYAPVAGWRVRGHDLKHLISQQRENFLAELKAIGNALPAIVNIEKIDHHLNPFDPGKLYMLFLKCLGEVQLDFWVEEMMLRRFHEVLCWNLGSLYAEINEKLSYHSALSFK
jgi:hypothetical protein